MSTSWSFLKWSTPTFLHNFSKFTLFGKHENNFHSNTILEIKTQGSQSKSLNYVKQFSKNVVSEIQTLKFLTTRLTILGQIVWWRRFSVNLMVRFEFINKFHNLLFLENTGTRRNRNNFAKFHQNLCILLCSQLIDYSINKLAQCLLQSNRRARSSERAFKRVAREIQIVFCLSPHSYLTLN